ncbi:MAG: DUF4013 domain-containing protein [Chloroflexota bacterium]
MNVNKALTFVFEDDEWVSKILLGTVISLIPLFGGAAVTGYTIAVLRSVREGRSHRLPTWDRLGDYFVDGLLYWVALLIYSIPLLILLCPIALVWVLPAASNDRQGLTNALTTVAALVSAGLGCLALLYALLLWAVTPVLQIRYAEAGKLGACLRFADVFRFLFANIGPIIIAQILVWAAGLVATTVLGLVIGAFGLVPICGWVVASLLGLLFLPLGVWLMLFAAHLYGDIAHGAAASTAMV